MGFVINAIYSMAYGLHAMQQSLCPGYKVGPALNTVHSVPTTRRTADPQVCVLCLTLGSMRRHAAHRRTQAA